MKPDHGDAHGMGMPCSRSLGCRLETGWEPLMKNSFPQMITCLIFFYCLFLREKRVHTSRRGAEREGDTESQAGSRLQAPSCQHRAQCGAWTHEPWDHDLSQSWMLNWLSYVGAPRLFKFIFILREIASGVGEAGQREWESQAGSALSTQNPVQCPNPRTMRSWPELKSRVGRLTNWAIQVPRNYFFLTEL